MCIFPRAVSLLFCCGFSCFGSLRYYLCEVAERSSFSRALPPQPGFYPYQSYFNLLLHLPTGYPAIPDWAHSQSLSDRRIHFCSLYSAISAQGATMYLGRPGLLASFLSVFTRALLSLHCLLSSPCTATTVVQASSFP